MKEQTLKKSELNIQDAYDYGRITMRREHLIPCSLQEEDEDIIPKSLFTEKTEVCQCPVNI